MKSHNKYAKLPQDLDLSFQSDLDLLPDTAADIDLDIDVDVDALNLSSPAALDLLDDEDDEIVIATSGGGSGAGSGGGKGGLRLAPKAKQRKNPLEEQNFHSKNKICGLGSDSVIEFSPVRSVRPHTSRTMTELMPECNLWLIHPCLGPRRIPFSRIYSGAI